MLKFSFLIKIINFNIFFFKLIGDIVNGRFADGDQRLLIGSVSFFRFSRQICTHCLNLFGLCVVNYWNGRKHRCREKNIHNRRD